MDTKTEPKWRVTAPAVLVKTAGTLPHSRSSQSVVTLYRGALLPVDVPPNQVQHLLASHNSHAASPSRDEELH